jgi:hypothetical protein
MSGLTSKWFLLTIAFVAVTTACSENPGRNPVAPSALGGNANRTAVEPGAVAASHGLAFTAVVGQGAGTLDVTASSRKGAFTLNAQVSVNVHGVSPNAVLYLVRSGDIALGGQQADGVCQRAAAGLFFPVLVNGSPVSLETSPGGAGAVHFELQGNDPFLPDGAGVDVVYRLVEALPPAAPSIDLRTACFTFTAK